MHFIRRSALRAASSSPSTSFISKSRSINASSPFLLRSKVQATGISPSVFRRFASDDSSSNSPSSSDGEQSSVSSAVESVASKVGDAAASLTNNATQAKDAFVDTAAGTAAAAGIGYQPREDRRTYGGRNDRNDRGYGGGRDSGRSGGYGGDRGDRGGRGLDNGGGFGRRDAAPMVPTPTVYVGNLLFDITANDLQREFGAYGDVKSAVIATDPRGLSKGFGYVEFESIANATAAIEGKHQQVFEGRRLVVNYQNKTKREDKTNPPSKTLFIGNLAFEMSDADLNKLFRDIKNVIDVRVAIDRRTGQPRGFAHADFVDVDSAVKGFEVLKDQEIYGRKLRVDYSVSSRERSNDGESSSGSSF